MVCSKEHDGCWFVIDEHYYSPNEQTEVRGQDKYSGLARAASDGPTPHY